MVSSKVGSSAWTVIVGRKLDGGEFVIPWGDWSEEVGGSLLRGVVGGVGGGVAWWALILLSAPFGVYAGKCGVDALTVVGVGNGVVGLWDGKLVAASPALVGVVGLAAGVVAYESFAIGAAVLSNRNMANVALLW